MNIANPVFRTRALAWLGLVALSLPLTGGTCTEDRTIQVAANAEVTVTYPARDAIGSFEGSWLVNLATEADIGEILKDNGFEGRVVAYIEGAFVRVTRRDDVAAERTVTGTVAVAENGGAEFPLITDQSFVVEDPSEAEWRPVPLEEPGVSLIHDALEEYLTDIYEGQPEPTEPVLRFHVSGALEPQGVASDFDWEVRMVVVLIGEREVTIVDPL